MHTAEAVTHRWPSAGALALPFFLLLTGCGTAPPDTSRGREVMPTVDPIAWRLFDERLWAASLSARHEALIYAQEATHAWLRQVQRQTETDFIPWYTSFGTQQWLSVKTGWYAMSQSDDGPTPADRLTAYLQREYYERVLEPVAETINPRVITERAALRYLRMLHSGMRKILRRIPLPPGALERRLKRIPAIHVDSKPPQRASLQELLVNSDPSATPGFQGLLSRVQPIGGGKGAEQPRHRFFPVTQENADELAKDLGMRGGMSAAALAAGGLGGILISVGISAWQAIEHEQDKPTMEAKLRENLHRALSLIRHELLRDPRNGVMAVVNHMGGNVENALRRPELETRLPSSRGDATTTMPEGAEPTPPHPR
jgi:hypothetical protein